MNLYMRRQARRDETQDVIVMRLSWVNRLCHASVALALLATSAITTSVQGANLVDAASTKESRFYVKTSDEPQNHSFDEVSNAPCSFNTPNGEYRTQSDFTPRSSSGFLVACLGDRNIVYRAQSAPSNIFVPPAEASSSSSSITSPQVSAATSGLPLPPVIGGETTFHPEPNTPATGEPTTIQKLLKYGNEFSGSYMFIPSGSKRGLGFHELDARLGFAIPCSTLQNLNNTNNGYFLITPRFTYDNVFTSKDLGEERENFFNTGFTTTFLMNYNDLEAQVEYSMGLSSSFKNVACDALYFRGRAEFGLPIDATRHVRLFGGVEYLDTIKYKLLPIAGLKYVSDDGLNVLRLAFPNPRWDHFLTKVNETDWWLFVHGDITADRWHMKSDEITVRGSHSFNLDYSDYKFGIGLSFNCPTRMRGTFEIGGAFGRETRTKEGVYYKPKDQVYLKTGIAY